MESPIVGIKQTITRTVREADLDASEIKDVELVGENEFYKIYSNGLLVRLNHQENFFPLPNEMPMARLPEISYPTVATPGK